MQNCQKGKKKGEQKECTESFKLSGRVDDVPMTHIRDKG